MLPSTVWLIVLIVLLVFEAVTVGLTFVWFAVGALGGLVVAGLGGQVWLQIVVFLALSALSLVLARPLATRFLKPGMSATNADRAIGKTAIVTEAIDNTQGKGQVSVSGQIWSARSAHDVVLPVDAQVKILRIEGVKVIVESV